MLDVRDVVPAVTTDNREPALGPLEDGCGVHPHPSRVRCSRVRVQCAGITPAGQPVSPLKDGKDGKDSDSDNDEDSGHNRHDNNISVVILIVLASLLQDWTTLMSPCLETADSHLNHNGDGWSPRPASKPGDLSHEHCITSLDVSAGNVTQILGQDPHNPLNLSRTHTYPWVPIDNLWITCA